MREPPPDHSQSRAGVQQRCLVLGTCLLGCHLWTLLCRYKQSDAGTPVLTPPGLFTHAAPESASPLHHLSPDAQPLAALKRGSPSGVSGPALQSRNSSAFRPWRTARVSPHPPPGVSWRESPGRGGTPAHCPPSTAVPMCVRNHQPTLQATHRPPALGGGGVTVPP